MCGPLRNQSDPVPEPFPPGTRVNINHDNGIVRGTVRQNVPIPFAEIGLPADPSGVTSTTTHLYTIHLDTGATVEVTFEDLVPPTTSSPVEPTDNAFDGLPHFLSQDAKVTLDHNGAYHKGFLHYSPDAGFQFIVKRNLRSTKVDFVVPLPNLKQN